MRKYLDPHQLKTWLAVLTLAVAVIVIFHVVSEFAVIAGWIGGFFNIVAPFIWGFMIAYVLNLPRERFESLLERVGYPLVQKWKRGLSVLATYLALIIVIVIASILIIPRVYAGLRDFFTFLPTLLDNLYDFLYGLAENEAVPFIDTEMVADIFNTEDILELINPDNFMAAVGTIFGLTSTIFRLALALISSVYFLVEAERIKAFTARVLKVLMPSSFYPSFMKYGREINTYFKRYIFCQTIDAAILGTIMTIAMSVMGVGYAFVLGPMLGFANLIPYFGSIVGTMIAIAVIMLTDGVNLGLIATVVLLVIQQIDANFIFPRLLGGSMKIPPLLVIIGIAVGNAFYGILGMIMAIPIVTVLRNIIDEALTYFEAKKARKNRDKEVDADEKRKRSET